MLISLLREDCMKMTLPMDFYRPCHLKRNQTLSLLFNYFHSSLAECNCNNYIAPKFPANLDDFFLLYYMLQDICSSLKSSNILYGFIHMKKVFQLSGKTKKITKKNRIKEIKQLNNTKLIFQSFQN